MKLIAVSKTQAPEKIREAYDAGQRLFGENRVQEMLQKHEQLPADIEWHMIGHLQKNKVKYIAPFVSMIHSVDSPELLEVVNKEAIKNSRMISCLLQVYIASEETKFGFDANEITAFLASDRFHALSNIRVCGLMGMASNTEHMQQVQLEFRTLRTLFDQLKAGFFDGSGYFKELSMGMSHDFKIAIEEGSTMVRVGSLIFGSRQ